MTIYKILAGDFIPFLVVVEEKKKLKIYVNNEIDMKEEEKKELILDKFHIFQVIHDFDQIWIPRDPLMREHGDAVLVLKDNQYTYVSRNIMTFELPDDTIIQIMSQFGDRYIDPVLFFIGEHFIYFIEPNPAINRIPRKFIKHVDNPNTMDYDEFEEIFCFYYDVKKDTLKHKIYGFEKINVSII